MRTCLNVNVREMRLTNVGFLKIVPEMYTVSFLQKFTP